MDVAPEAMSAASFLDKLPSLWLNLWRKINQHVDVTSMRHPPVGNGPEDEKSSAFALGVGAGFRHDCSRRIPPTSGLLALSLADSQKARHLCLPRKPFLPWT